jgi:transcriptional regulator with XRE-family HTH domain
VNFARALRMARAARGMSQQELARLVEIRPSYLSMLERGDRKNPSSDLVSKIARALNIPVPLFMLLGSDQSELNLISPPDANKLARALLEALTESPAT